MKLNDHVDFLLHLMIMDFDWLMSGEVRIPICVTCLGTVRTFYFTYCMPSSSSSSINEKKHSKLPIYPSN